MKDRLDTVLFTQQQLDFLERHFPIITYGPQTSSEVMHHYFGQRTVLDTIRRNTSGHKRNEHASATR
jgi:hypothetical protein